MKLFRFEKVGLKWPVIWIQCLLFSLYFLSRDKCAIKKTCQLEPVVSEIRAFKQTYVVL